VAEVDSHINLFRQALNGPAPIGLPPRSTSSPEPPEPPMSAKARIWPDVPAMPEAPGVGIPDTRAVVAAVMDEVRRMIVDEFTRQQKTQQEMVRDFIEQEWKARLAEIQIGITSHNGLLANRFTENRTLALQVGEEVVRVKHAIEELRNYSEDAGVWRREMDPKILKLEQEVRDQKARKDEMLRLAQDAARERDGLMRKVLEIERVRDDVQARAQRLEEECDRRVRPQLQDLSRSLDKVVQDQLTSGTELREWKGSLGVRMDALEEASKEAGKKLGKSRDRLQRHAENIQSVQEAADELYGLVSKAERPGYCSGCRLVREECDKKLFTVKESICFLSERMKLTARGDSAASAGGPTLAAGGGTAAPAVPQQQGGGAATAAAVDAFELRLSALEAQVADVNRKTEQALRESSAAREAATNAAAADRTLGPDRSLRSDRSTDDAGPAASQALVKEVMAELITPLHKCIKDEVDPVMVRVEALEQRADAVDRAIENLRDY